LAFLEVKFKVIYVSVKEKGEGDMLKTENIHKFLSTAVVSTLLLSVNLLADEQDAVDTSFGTNGKVLEVLSEENGGAQHRAVKVYGDDKIIVAGVARNANDVNVMALYRYLPDGTRDMSFGTDGASYADHVCQDVKTCGTMFITGGDGAEDIMFQSDGKILIARTEYEGEDGYNPDPYPGLARFNADGTLDTTFGYYYGYTMASWDVYYGYAVAGAVQQDDKIMVVGHGVMDSANDSSLLLSRFNANGSLDTDFGSHGTISIDTSPADSYYRDAGYDVTVQSDGKILVVGRTQVKGCAEDVNGTYSRGLLLRFNLDGTLDSSFDSDGIVKFTAASVFDVKPWDLSETYPCEDSVFRAVAVQPDGKIVVAGKGWNSPYALFVARFNSNGSLDTTFGYEGVRALYHDYDYEVFDHLNTTFTYISGRSYSTPGDNIGMVLQKDGGISISGMQKYGPYSFMAWHLTKDGNFDKRYGTNGVATVNILFPDEEYNNWSGAFDLDEQSDGKLILAGYADDDYHPSTALTVRTVKKPVSLSPVIMYLLN